MAAIDKLYGNLTQYQELQAWCTAHLPAALGYFYEWDARWENQAMTNFPEWIDYQLLKRCPLAWVIEQVSDSYDLDNGGEWPDEVDNSR